MAIISKLICYFSTVIQRLLTLYTYDFLLPEINRKEQILLELLTSLTQEENDQKTCYSTPILDLNDQFIFRFSSSVIVQLLI